MLSQYHLSLKSVECEWGNPLQEVKASPGLELSIHPVSYTHLDVYKRQIIILIQIQLHKYMNQYHNSHQELHSFQHYCCHFDSSASVVVTSHFTTTHVLHSSLSLLPDPLHIPVSHLLPTPPHIHPINVQHVYEWNVKIC